MPTHCQKPPDQPSQTTHQNKPLVFTKLLLAAGLVAVTAFMLVRAQTSYAALTSDDLAAAIRRAGVPAGKVESFPVPDARGTAMLIPQIHQGPGTDASEPANDSAKRAQEEIYKIVTYLAKDAEVTLLMAEGDLYGQGSGEKIQQTKAKLDAKNRLIGLLGQFKTSISRQSIHPAIEARASANLEKTIAAADREIILKGAPYKLKAEGLPLTLYGAENQATYERSANIVRDYFYLQDRLAQLAPSSQKTGFQDSLPEPGHITAATLSLTSKQGSLAADLARLQQLASSRGNSAQASLLADIQATLRQLLTTGIQPASQNTAPSRTNNPYANVSSPAVLRAKLTAAEQNIQTVIVDQRNRETAENFARMLTAEKQDTGILQFGAQHASGLTQELQKQGLSVIVITPKEVLSARARDTRAPTNTTALRVSHPLLKIFQHLKQKNTPGFAGASVGQRFSASQDQRQLADRRAVLLQLLLSKNPSARNLFQ